jgi:tryptophanyl-tRNA synthetase
MSKPVIFSGIQPTGNLHLGNYLGAVKNWVELQNSGKYDCYFCVVDYHSLTGKMTAEERREKIFNVTVELLALGIDPKKSTFFVQSHVPEHTELAWVFNSLTPVSELYRMTQFKDKTGGSQTLNDIETALQVVEKENGPAQAVARNTLSFLRSLNQASAGLLTYPILQAADILLYKGDLVPVGQDQVQHIELTRDIARWFNKKYGEFFPETKHKLTEIPKVMSLLEPTKKMSKSLGQGHVIEICEDGKEIEAKLKKAVTATEGGGESAGVQNLLGLLKEFGSAEKYHEFSKAEKNGSIRYGDLKKELASSIANHFAKFRTKRTELLKNKKTVEEILQSGASQAKKVAEETMEGVRKLIGIR